MESMNAHEPQEQVQEQVQQQVQEQEQAAPEAPPVKEPQTVAALQQELQALKEQKTRQQLLEEVRALL